MTQYFISDLHLCPERPDITAWFETFIKDKARGSRALYVLGDLFEYWLGDDALTPLAEQVATWLKSLSDAGTQVYFMAGNRDFLIGEAYAQQAGLTLLEEPTLIDLGGTQTLLVHGDAECTDDVAYQKARQMLRNPAWQKDFLSKSIPERIAFAEQARKQSQSHTQSSQMEIMDVNQEAIQSLFEKHQVSQMIHGHTHRPAIHQHGENTRIVLGDWHKQASYLQCDDSGMQLIHT